MKYDVTGMSCAACQARVQKAVSKVDGVTNCAVNLLTNSMTVDGDVSSNIIIKAVQDAGYGAAVQSDKPIRQTKSAISDEIRNAIIRLISSGFILLILMYFGMGIMLGLPAPSVIKDNKVILGIVEFLLSGIILIINRKFFINGTKGLVRLSPNMDTLVALGSGVSFIYSTVILILLALGKNVQNCDYYFESAAMILVLITVGKLLEAVAKGRTTDALRALSNLTPQNAVVVRDGQEKVISIDELVVGDEIVIRPGENVPADGKVISGSTSINESALTGESMPVNKSSNDEVYTGTVNISGVIHIRAEKIGTETVLSKIIAMVSDASAAKAPIARVADKVSGVFVPVVTLIALITALIWLFAGQTLEFALVRGICVLVISCPCALGLATPVAIMVGSGVAARHNILFKTAESLERTGRIKTVILDKTGTVTKGVPEITGIHRIDQNVPEQSILQMAYSVEYNSRHPLAMTVCRYAESKNVSLIEVDDVTESAGHGVSAVTHDKNVIVVGNADYIATQTDNEKERAAFTDRLAEINSDGQTVIVVAKDKHPVGAITFSDEIKPDSIDAVIRLHKMGLSVCLLSGDNRAAVNRVGQQINADKIFGEVLPDQKATVVSEMQKSGSVMMVGDGINDAVALTAADVGTAIGAGTDVAKDAADIVLVRNSVSDVASSIKIGRSVLRNIYENLFWAFIYNIIGIPIAAGVWYPIFGLVLTPALGALAMSLSSFCVVSNALRLNLIRLPKVKTFSENDISITENQMKESSTMTKTMKIEGMMCGHCEARVKKTLEAIDGVTLATPSHTAGTAIVEMSKDVADDVLKKAVEDQDYKVTGIE